MEKNNATSPSHYKTGGLEVITILRKKLTPEEFKGFCKGNILKYVLRADKKNGSEDLKKAQVYLKWLTEAVEASERVRQDMPNFEGGDEE